MQGHLEAAALGAKGEAPASKPAAAAKGCALALRKHGRQDVVHLCATASALRRALLDFLICPACKMKPPRRMTHSLIFPKAQAQSGHMQHSWLCTRMAASPPSACTSTCWVTYQREPSHTCIVALALGGVGQDAVGRIDLLEFFLCLAPVVRRGLVRVVLQRGPFVRLQI